MSKPILKAYFDRIFFEFITHNHQTDSILILQGFPDSGNTKN